MCGVTHQRSGHAQSGLGEVRSGGLSGVQRKRNKEEWSRVGWLLHSVVHVGS